jgi:hypothetical protein
MNLPADLAAATAAIPYATAGPPRHVAQALIRPVRVAHARPQQAHKMRAGPSDLQLAAAAPFSPRRPLEARAWLQLLAPALNVDPADMPHCARSVECMLPTKSPQFTVRKQSGAAVDTPTSIHTPWAGTPLEQLAHNPFAMSDAEREAAAPGIAPAQQDEAAQPGERIAAQPAGSMPGVELPPAHSILRQGVSKVVSPRRRTMRVPVPAVAAASAAHESSKAASSRTGDVRLSAAVSTLERSKAGESEHEGGAAQSSTSQQRRHGVGEAAGSTLDEALIWPCEPLCATVGPQDLTVMNTQHSASPYCVLAPHSLAAGDKQPAVGRRPMLGVRLACLKRAVRSLCSRMKGGWASIPTACPIAEGRTQGAPGRGRSRAPAAQERRSATSQGAGRSRRGTADSNEPGSSNGSGSPTFSEHIASEAARLVQDMRQSLSFTERPPAGTTRGAQANGAVASTSERTPAHDDSDSAHRAAQTRQQSARQHLAAMRRRGSSMMSTVHETASTQPVAHDADVASVLAQERRVRMCLHRRAARQGLQQELDTLSAAVQLALQQPQGVQQRHRIAPHADSVQAIRRRPVAAPGGNARASFAQPTMQHSGSTLRREARDAARQRIRLSAGAGAQTARPPARSTVASQAAPIAGSPAGSRPSTAPPAGPDAALRRLRDRRRESNVRASAPTRPWSAQQPSSPSAAASAQVAAAGMGQPRPSSAKAATLALLGSPRRPRPAESRAQPTGANALPADSLNAGRGQRPRVDKTAGQVSGQPTQARAGAKRRTSDGMLDASAADQPDTLVRTERSLQSSRPAASDGKGEDRRGVQRTTSARALEPQANSRRISDRDIPAERSEALRRLAAVYGAPSNTARRSARRQSQEHVDAAAPSSSRASIGPGAKLAPIAEGSGGLSNSLQSPRGHARSTQRPLAAASSLPSVSSTPVPLASAVLKHSTSAAERGRTTHGSAGVHTMPAAPGGPGVGSSRGLPRQASEKTRAPRALEVIASGASAHRWAHRGTTLSAAAPIAASSPRNAATSGSTSAFLEESGKRASQDCDKAMSQGLPVGHSSQPPSNGQVGCSALQAASSTAGGGLLAQAPARTRSTKLAQIQAIHEALQGL